MSNITIQQITERKELKRFVRFNYELYKTCPYAVPDLLEDTMDTFDPKKNAAFEFCDAAFFIALDGNGKMVGRVAAIINRKANDTWNTRCVRFGWIDFVDDIEVSRALLDTVAAWGRERGMDTIEGPLGFTDMDPEGMLTDGFDQLGTMATIYNFPYYPQHMERLGFGKAIDWVERKIFIPRGDEHKADEAIFFRVGKMSSERYHLHVKKLKKQREVREGGYGQKIFNLINEAYAPLFGFSAMNDRQIAQYVKTYLQFVDLRLVTLVENEQGEVIAVGIGMPSLARAIQKAHARMFPFGWFHLAKALYIKRSPIADLLLIAVKPEYQNKGVNAILFADLIPIYQNMGFTFAESHPQLETNEKSQNQWTHLDNVVHKRRRCYKAPIIPTEGETSEAASLSKGEEA